MRKVLLLLLMLVFATPSSAAACAWVLWARGAVSTRGVPLGLILMEASEDSKSCEERALLHNTQNAAAYPHIRFFYLPDTVDPRGPKGKE